MLPFPTPKLFSTSLPLFLSIFFFSLSATNTGSFDLGYEVVVLLGLVLHSTATVEENE